MKTALRLLFLSLPLLVGVIIAAAAAPTKLWLTLLCAVVFIVNGIWWNYLWQRGRFWHGKL
jgi:hypothetical protein